MTDALPHCQPKDSQLTTDHGRRPWPAVPLTCRHHSGIIVSFVTKLRSLVGALEPPEDVH